MVQNQQMPQLAGDNGNSAHSNAHSANGNASPAGATPSAAPSAAVKVGFYEVDRTIGKGNYAVVKLARHRITKTEVAIKIVDKRRLDSSNLAKVYREIEVLKKLRHPNIVRLYQVMETNNMLYLVTEYAPNGEIFDLISKQQRLSEESARDKFWQIISAVDYLHQQHIVHRDLKAENLLLDANFRIKLADFGFSNFYSPFDTLNTFCGSPPYAAPEVFEGKRYLGPEIDIWSLGVILYVMVCGVLPFEGVNLQLLRDRVLSGRIRIPYFMSSDCENLIRRMLTVDSRRRPTIAQIRGHPWMRAEQLAQKYAAHSEQRPEQPQQAEPHPQILRLMNNLGIESHKVKNAILTEAYDNFHAIYLLLLERLKGQPLSPSQSSNRVASSASSASLCSGPGPNPTPVQTPQSAPVAPSPTQKQAPAVVLTADGAAASSVRALIRGGMHTKRRQSDGVTIVPCQCCCCTAALVQPMQRGPQQQQPAQTPVGMVSRFAHQQQHQQRRDSAHAELGARQEEGNVPRGPQQITHHPSSSDYESEGNCCSGSSATGSTLSRQSTIGTINSFDEGIVDSDGCAAHSGGSGILLFGGVPPQHLCCAGEPLPAFESQLSQDPLFSSQSSNNSYAAFRTLGSSSSSGPEAACCCPSAAGAGGTGGNLVGQVQLHPLCGGGHFHRPLGAHPAQRHLHQLPHPHLLKPVQPLTQPASAREAASAGENGAQTSGTGIPGMCVQQQLLLFGNGLRASDNAIGDSALGFPTGQLGKRNRAQNEIHRPSGSGAPLHSQLRRMRISTGLAQLAKAVPLAVGVTAAPRAPVPSQVPDKHAVRHVLGCLPKRISLPENLQFQPQMLLNLKQSIHVEKQLTSTSEASDPVSELNAFEKPVLKGTRLQQYQHQQQQKRKAARLQLLRQQSYQMAQKQSVIAVANSQLNGNMSPFLQGLHLQINQPAKLEQLMDAEGAQQDRIPLSPIEDLKAEEVMDTS